MSQIDLNTFAEGQLREAFQGSFEKVIKNMNDPNCRATAKREITMKLVFSPNEWRDQFKVVVSTKEKLAAKFPVETLIYMGKDLTTGQIEYEEAGTGLRGQMTINDYIQAEPAAEAEKPETVTNITRYQKEA